VGFELGEAGASRLFLQLNRDVEYDTRVDDKGVFHITLVGARYSKRNTLRWIDTRFFDTSLAMIRTKRVRRSRARGTRPAQRAGIKLSLSFKTPEDAQTPQLSLSQGQDGYHYLYIGLAPAKERAADGAGAADDDVAP